MDRRGHLASLWSWLPAFRAVGETEHLPSAAREMAVTPSALSRSVTQLEDALGHALFVRANGRMRLSPAGSELLAAVRDAMRRIDDGITRLASERPGRLRIAGDGAWIALLVTPALADHVVEVEQVIATATDATLREPLVRGAIDLAIVETAVPADDVVIERLGPLPRAVCHGGRTRRPPEVFAVWTGGSDGWPPELPRRVVLRSPRLDTILEACRSGTVAAVLPVALARSHGLHAHRSPRLGDSQLLLVRRTPLGDSVTETLVPAIRERAAELL